MCNIDAIIPVNIIVPRPRETYNIFCPCSLSVPHKRVLPDNKKRLAEEIVVWDQGVIVLALSGHQKKGVWLGEAQSDSVQSSPVK